MTSNNILLISVPVTRSFKKELPHLVSMPPSGLLYLAAHARKQGYKVTIIDFAVHFYSKSEFEKIVNKIKPGVIGISTFTESWSATKLLARYIKNIFPDIYLVAGGNCATFIYDHLEEYGIEILSSNLDKYTMDNPIINPKNFKASELRRYLQLFSKALISGSHKIEWNHL